VVELYPLPRLGRENPAQPIYTLKNAGLHGDGLTSSQDVGLNPGERREYAAKQEPKGVKGRPKITKCAPKFDEILGVELG
jgi:hypothetical protein